MRFVYSTLQSAKVPGTLAMSLATELASILDTARKILKEDIDHNLSNITPTYNSESLEASWDIPDLITALYFSILFLNPNFKIVKKCKNPNCINYFTVYKSNDRKMYCSDACGNAMSQRKFRERNKKE